MDHFKQEAERLLNDFIRESNPTYMSAEETKKALTALLAHIERGPKLDKPARVGNGTFHTGVSARHVIEAAQRLYEVEAERGPRTPEQVREEERMRRKAWEMFNGPLDADIERGRVPCSEDQVRASFERYASLRGMSLEPTAGSYKSQATKSAWRAWQYLHTTGGAVLAAPEHSGDAAELGPDFSDLARAALLWVLWHHQGGSSPVGQPIRFALGMGRHEHLSDWQVAEAKRWGELRGFGPGDCREPAPAPADGASLSKCQARLFDVLVGDDGQAWAEAERYLETARPDLYAALRREVKP